MNEALEKHNNLDSEAAAGSALYCDKKLQLYREPEFWLLLWAFTCLVFLAFWYLILYLYPSYPGSKKAASLLKTTFAHLLGGVIAGVGTCASSKEFSSWENLFLNIIVSSAAVSTVHALFSLSFRKLFKISFLESTFEGLAKSADSQKKHLVSLGIPGVFFFVWIPFFMTGPIVGSILGRLIGLKLFTNLATVMIASITSIATWVFFWEQISRFVSEKKMSIMSISLVSFFLLYILWNRIKILFKQLKKEQ